MSNDLTAHDIGPLRWIRLRFAIFFLADAVINSMLSTQYRSGGVYFSLVLRMTHLALLKNLADIILFAKSDERLC